MVLFCCLRPSVQEKEDTQVTTKVPERVQSHQANHRCEPGALVAGEPLFRWASEHQGAPDALEHLRKALGADALRLYGLDSNFSSDFVAQDNTFLVLLDDTGEADRAYGDEEEELTTCRQVVSLKAPQCRGAPLPLSAAEGNAQAPCCIHAGLPLFQGQALVGVLHVVVRRPSAQGDHGRTNNQRDRASASSSDDPAREERSGDLARALQDPQALKHLAASVSLAMAGANRLAELGHVAAGLGRLHRCTTLTDLVCGLSRTLHDEVLRLHALEADVQVALVPQRASPVAYLLQRGTGPGEVTLEGLPAKQEMLAVVAPEEVVLGSITLGSVDVPAVSKSGSRRALRRAHTVSTTRLLATTAAANRASHLSPAAVSSGGGLDEGQAPRTAAGPANAGTATGPAGPSGQQPQDGAAAAAAAAAAAGKTGSRQASAPQHAVAHASNAAAAGSNFSRAPSSPNGRRVADLAGASSADMTAMVSPGHVLALDARAFPTSNTLLQRLENELRAQAAAKAAGAAAEAGKPPQGAAGLHPGLVVEDTAGWINTPGNPSRDVCMMLAQRPPSSSAAGTGGGPAVASYSGMLTTVAPTRSVVLLGLEVARPQEQGPASSVLGLYLVFPVRLPQSLLVAVRDTCNRLLGTLCGPLRTRLTDPADLRSEWDTLRSGVPGSYVVLQPPSRDTAESAFGAATSAVAHHSSGPLFPIRASRGEASTENLPGTAPVMRMPELRTASGHHDAWLQAHGASGRARAASASLARAQRPGQGVMRLLQTPGSPAAALVPAGMELRMGPFMTSATAQREAQLPSASSRRSVWRVHTAVPVGGAGTGAPGEPHAGDSGSHALTPTWVTKGSREAAAANPFDSAGASTAGQHAAAQPGTPRLALGSLMQTVDVHDIKQGSFDPSLMDTFDRELMAGSESMHGRKGRSSATGMEAEGALLFPTATVLTVQDVDGSYSMRSHMGILVESMKSVVRGAGSSADAATAWSLNSPCDTCSDLEDLHLVDVIGEGASGVVLRGMLATTPVAVKLVEIPDGDLRVVVDESPGPSDARKSSLDQYLDETGKPGGAKGAAEKRMLTPPPAKATPAAGAAAAAPAQAAEAEAEAGAAPVSGRRYLPIKERDLEKQRRSNRELLQLAMELAVMQNVSHTNIVQVYAVYENVTLSRSDDVMGKRVFQLNRMPLNSGPDPEPQEGVPPGCAAPVCAAVVAELCDKGSLCDLLVKRTFPTWRQQQPPPQQQQQQGGSRSASPVARPPVLPVAVSITELDLQGVYLTLLELAMALRHLHSKRLVHRDVKPANVLLKSSPGDPRGWTCKLADFGFTMVLDKRGAPASGAQTASGATTVGVAVAATAAAPAAAGPNAAATAAGDAGGSSGLEGWYTVQESACGTVTHMAPEAMMKGGRIDASVDVFSMGIIMWELLCGRGYRPYAKVHPDDIPRAVVKGLRPTFTSDTPQAYRALAQSCWAVEPRARPTTAQLVVAIKQQLAALRSAGI